MSFRRNAIQQVGGFDPAYTGTNAFEAGDYCIRVKNAGYEVVFNPNAKVVHMSAPRKGIPRELSEPRTQFYQARNWTLFVGKNLGWKRRYLKHLWLVEPAHVFNTLEASVLRAVMIFFSNVSGKFVGTVAWIQWKYLGNKEPVVVWEGNRNEV